MNMEQMEIAILLTGCVVIPAIALVYWLLTRKNRREMMGYATVISRTPELALGVKWGSGWNYKILFEVGGHQFPLYVLQGDYETIQEGMSGMLIWQEENMISFTPDDT